MVYFVTIMAIHIYRKNETKDLLFEITDDLYETLSAAIDILENKTGIFIDNYGDSRLSHQHSELLLQLLRTEIEDKRISPNETVNDFIVFLKKVIHDKIDLEMIGD